MSSKVLNPNEFYIRLQDGNGSPINLSSGNLPCAIGSLTNSNHDDFQVNANLQVENIDVALGQYNMTSCLPVAIASDQSAVPVQASNLDIRALTNSDVVSSELTTTPTGSSTLYDNTSTSSESSSLDARYGKHISFIGTVNGAVTFTVEVSNDDSTFYSSGTQIVLSGSGEFHANFETAFRYVRLNPSTSITATVIGAYKM